MSRKKKSPCASPQQEKQQNAKNSFKLTSIIQQLCRLSPAICSPQSVPGVPACSRFLDPLLLRACFPSLTSEFSTNTLNFLQSLFHAQCIRLPSDCSSYTRLQLLTKPALNCCPQCSLEALPELVAELLLSLSAPGIHSHFPAALCDSSDIHRHAVAQSPQGSKVTMLPTGMEVKNSRLEQADPVCHSTAAKLCFPSTLGRLEPKWGFLLCQSLLQNSENNRKQTFSSCDLCFPYSTCKRTDNRCLPDVIPHLSVTRAFLLASALHFCSFSSRLHGIPTPV